MLRWRSEAIWKPHTHRRYLAGTLDWANNPAWTCNGKSQSPISIDTSKTTTAPASVVPDLEKAFIAALPRGLMGSVTNLTLSNTSTWWCIPHVL